MIFFDIDGTLIDHAAASAAASLSFFDHFGGEIAFPRAGFPQVWEQIVDRHFDRYCRGEISIWEQRRARIREAFDNVQMRDAECDARYRVYIDAYESLTAAFDDAKDCLARLRHQPLGIISNGARDQQIGKLERAGLLSYFSVLVFSEDAGIGKPSPRIFEEACRRAEAKPEECVHIGDDPAADVAGSAAAGLHPVWIDRYGRTPAPVGVPAITSLRELESVLDRDRLTTKGTYPCLARN